MDKKNKRDNRLVTYAIIVLLITIIALILVSSTYAKYVSTANGSDTATVAKWSFKVDETDILKSEHVEFDIFSTLESESAVSKTDGSLIAPGTQGSFNMELTNDSEVDAEYKVVYTVEKNDSNIPIKYSLDKSSWSDSIDSIDESAFTRIESGATQTTHTVYWKWDFDGNDVTDSALGKQSAEAASEDLRPKVTIKATVNVEQVN